MRFVIILLFGIPFLVVFTGIIAYFLYLCAYIILTAISS